MIDELQNILKTVGDGLLRWRGNAGGEWHGAQLKTDADGEAHQALSTALIGLLDISALSEEDPVSHTDPRPDRYWLIDLFDGFKRNTQTGSGRLEQ